MTRNIFSKFVYTTVLVFLMFITFPFVSVQATDGLVGGGDACSCEEGASKTAECAKYCTGNYSLNDIVGIGVKATLILLGLSGSVALLFFIYGGVTFLISGGSAEKVSKGKQIIVNSIIGIVIVFTSFIIIKYTMNALGYDTSVYGPWNQSK